MPRDSSNNFRKKKELARSRYIERQIDKWCKWSLKTRGRIKFKELVKQQDKYGIICT
jgi:hypothetical protein